MTAPTEPLKPEGVERRERIAAQLAGHIWTVYQTDGTAKEFPDWRRAVAIEATRVTNELIDALDNQLAEPRDDAAELRAALEGIVQLLTKPKTDPLRGMARVVGAIGIARAALAATEGSE